MSDPALANRQRTVTIASRFCGPKDSGNGGYVAGLLAQAIDGPADVRLRSRPPLERPLTIESDGQEAALLDGSTIVASARATSVHVDVPAMPSHEALEAAKAAHLNMPMVLPHCFVCGPKREPGDGLRIFAGPIDDSTVNADVWTPDESLTADDGLVAPEFLWAALDCPSGYALRLTEGFILLGSLAAEIRRRPQPGDELIAMGWAGEADGRKRPAASALMTLEKEVIAVARSVWIELKDAALVSALMEQSQ